MNEIKARGICLRSTEIGDSDKLCNIYFIGEGRKSVKFKSVKKAKGKLAFAASPLCYGEYFIMEKNGFYTCIGCDLISSFMNIWSDLDKYYCALSALELLDRFSNDEQEVDDIAIIVIDYITRLNSNSYKQSDYLSFLYRLFVVAGYGVSTATCPKCGAALEDRLHYSYAQSGYVCGNCIVDSMPVERGIYDIFASLSMSGNVTGEYPVQAIYQAVDIMLSQIIASCNIRLIAGGECLNNLKLLL